MAVADRNFAVAAGRGLGRPGTAGSAEEGRRASDPGRIEADDVHGARGHELQARAPMESMAASAWRRRGRSREKGGGRRGRGERRRRPAGGVAARRSWPAAEAMAWSRSEVL